MRGEPALSSCSDTRSGHPPEGVFPPTLRYPEHARRSGRVAEGGALLRRYGGTNLHRGFESLLLRLGRGPLRAAEPPSAGSSRRWPDSGREPVPRALFSRPTPTQRRARTENEVEIVCTHGGVAERSNAAVSKTVSGR